MRITKVIHFIRRRFFLSLLILFSLFDSSSFASPSSDYLQNLIHTAEALHLDQDPYWRVLLHYRYRWYHSAKSDIKAKAFFNSKEGRTNPSAELTATLARFFEPAPTDPAVQPSQCLFIDRYRWLKEKLHFDPALLPEQACKDFDFWKNALDPSSVTLVFSSYYMSNPSSTFGHTLLRLNHQGHVGNDRLLDYGVNYAANPTTDNALFYGILGLMGGFDGIFSNIPYFMKVAEYSDIESRDLWEYDLNFTQPQIDRMMYHLWSLGHIATPYYFFDQNCSYMLLAILDAANPDLKLGDEYDKMWVIPADTVRGVVEKPNLVSQVEVRPSLAFRLKKQMSLLSVAEKNLFFDLIQKPGSEKSKQTLARVIALTPDSKRKILDLGLDYFRYLTPKRKNHLLDGEQTLRTDLLDARADVQALSPDLAYTTEEMARERPDSGHRTARFTLGGGYQDLRGTFAELGWRPAFQDLNANTRGYPQGMQIDILDLAVRYSPRARHLGLERLSLANIISLEPYDALFKKFSWSLRVGADPIRDFECGECVEYKFNVGIGYTLQPATPISIYGLVKGDLGFGPNTHPGYRFGPAGEVGALLHLGDDLSLYAFAVYHHPLLGRLNAYWNKSVEARASLTHDTDVRFGYDSFPTAQQGKLLFNVYF